MSATQCDVSGLSHLVFSVPLCPFCKKSLVNSRSTVETVEISDSDDPELECALQAAKERSLVVDFKDGSTSKPASATEYRTIASAHKSSRLGKNKLKPTAPKGMETTRFGDAWRRNQEIVESTRKEGQQARKDKATGKGSGKYTMAGKQPSAIDIAVRNKVPVVGTFDVMTGCQGQNAKTFHHAGM